MEDKLIHKETFFQAEFEGVPSHWIVQYWINDPSGFPEASYFSSRQDAEEFENTMDWPSYDDWLESQEIPLSVQ